MPGLGPGGRARQELGAKVEGVVVVVRQVNLARHFLALGGRLQGVSVVASHRERRRLKRSDFSGLLSLVIVDHESRIRREAHDEADGFLGLLSSKGSLTDSE